ncbi:MAG: hypothetical protein MUF49_23265 [Oculatellaceae cyanobacterium Prado106]|jgi:hypothetical protein|nr:hypothetical protein [Oculatellaceae cyanobacterium Prado106]
MAKLMNVRSLMVLLLLLGGLPLSMSPAIGVANPSPAAPQLESRSLIAGWGSVFRRRNRRLTIRGGVCAIAPGLVGPIQVWSDRPLFVWQGSAQQLNIRSHDTREPLWTKTLDTPAEHLTYTGNALESGKLYQWQALNENPSESDKSQWFTFQVMPPDERNDITVDLQGIETEMRGETEDAIALRKAEYFTEKNLWSDALQVLYTIENPSEAILQTQRSVRSQFCAPQSAEATT